MAPGAAEPSEADAGFERFVDGLDIPVFIVTTVAVDGRRSGCLIGFATQCSIDPVRFLACISRANHTHEVAASAELLAVHLVPRGAYDLAELFGGETGDLVDKFERCSWTPGVGGVPILEDCSTWFVGRVLERVTGLGDHTGYLLEPVAASGVRTGPYVSFADARSIDAGHPS